MFSSIYILNSFLESERQGAWFLFRNEQVFGGRRDSRDPTICHFLSNLS